MPTREQWEELKDHCKWEWVDNGYMVIGPNDNSIVLPAEGYRYKTVSCTGPYGFYWSSTPNDLDSAWGIYFDSDDVYMNCNYRCYNKSVRLVKQKHE